MRIVRRLIIVLCVVIQNIVLHCQVTDAAYHSVNKKKSHGRYTSRGQATKKATGASGTCGLMDKIEKSLEAKDRRTRNICDGKRSESSSHIECASFLKMARVYIGAS